MDYDELWRLVGEETTLVRLHTCIKCMGGVDFDEYNRNDFVCDSCRDNWDAFPIRTWSDPQQRTEAERAANGGTEAC